MLAAAVVPHPPLLVPAIAAGTGPEAAPLLAACDAAVSALLAEVPEVIVCVGPGRTTIRHPPGAWGTLSGFGVEVPAPGTHHVGRPHLPLSLTLGRRLLDRAGWDGLVIAQEMGPGATPEECVTIGQRLRGEINGRNCWLILGDGSTKRGERGADPLDDHGARLYDDAIAAAFAAGDVARIVGLDIATAEQAGAGGRGAWQVLAGAVQAGTGVGRSSVTYSGAPFGVGYVVANWWLTS